MRPLRHRGAILLICLLVGGAIALYFRSAFGGISSLPIVIFYLSVAVGFTFFAYAANKWVDRAKHTEAFDDIGVSGENEVSDTLELTAEREDAVPNREQAPILGAVKEIHLWIRLYRDGIYATIWTMIALLLLAKIVLTPIFRLLGIDDVLDLSVALLSLATSLTLPLGLVAILDQAARRELLTSKRRRNLKAIRNGIQEWITTTWNSSDFAASPERSRDMMQVGLVEITSSLASEESNEDRPADEIEGDALRQPGLRSALTSPGSRKMAFVTACIVMLGATGGALLLGKLSQSDAPRVALALGDGFTVRRDAIAHHPGVDVTRRLILRHFNSIELYKNSVSSAIEDEQYLDALIIAYVNGSLSGMANVSRQLSAPANRDSWTIELSATGMPLLMPNAEYRRSIEHHVLLLDNTLLLEAFLFESLGNREAARKRYVQYYEFVKALSFNETGSSNPIGILPRLWLAKAKLIELKTLPTDASANEELNNFLRPLFITRSHFLLIKYHDLAPREIRCESTQQDCLPRFSPDADASLSTLDNFAQLHRAVYGRSIFASITQKESYSGSFECCSTLDSQLARIDRLEADVSKFNEELAPLRDDVVLMRLEVLRYAATITSKPELKRRYCEALTNANSMRDATLEQFDGLDILRKYLDDKERLCPNA